MHTRATAAVETLRGHRSGRAILAGARRLRPAVRAASAYRTRQRTQLAAAGRFVAAVRGRRHVAERASALQDLVDHLPPPPPVAPERDLVYLLDPACEPCDPHVLARLAAEIGGDIVAATPLLVHPRRRLPRSTPDDLTTRALGVDVVLDAGGAPITRAREAGEAFPTGRPISVTGATGACLVIDRRALEGAGGLRSLGDADADAFDVCRRLRAAGGRIVAVPDAIAFDHRPVPADRPTVPIDPRGAPWRRIIDADGAALWRAASGAAGPTAPPLRFAVTVAAPSAKVAPRWGDWHLAEALSRALRRLGHDAIVQTLDHADDPAGRARDVHVVLRGRAPVRRTCGQRHVLWVISHPETVTQDECDEADLVVVASERFAAQLQRRTATPVAVLLQATDHRRFRPMPPDAEHEHPVVVVAKTRDVMRRAVADAIAAGLRPAIYGAGWREFVDPELVVADYIANEEIPAVYASAGVLLNDHWDSMREWGFVSNRLFDALACGTPVISDHVPEISQLFGDAVPTYETAADLRALVDDALVDPAAARARADAGRRRVLAAHTFDHRARELVELLARPVSSSPGGPNSGCRAGPDPAFAG